MDELLPSLYSLASVGKTFDQILALQPFCCGGQTAQKRQNVLNTSILILDKAWARSGRVFISYSPKLCLLD